MLKLVSFLLLGWLTAMASPVSGETGEVVAPMRSCAAIRGHSHAPDRHDGVPAGPSETLIEAEETEETSVKIGLSIRFDNPFGMRSNLISSRMDASLDWQHPFLPTSTRSAILRC